MLDPQTISEITISHTVRMAKINARLDKLCADLALVASKLTNPQPTQSYKNNVVKLALVR